MTTKKTYFFDTYAIIETLNGSNTYINYTDCNAIITKLNLFELFFKFLNIGNRERALFYFEQYKQFVKEFDEEDIKAAAEIKLINRRFSMADCIGYIVALKAGIKFLTGDKEFENMPNVEFVK